MPRTGRKRALVVVHSYYLRDTRPRRHASALARAGWHVDVICARDRGEPRVEVADGVSLARLPARRLRPGSRLRYVFEYLSFTALAFLAVTAAHLRRRYRVVYVVGVPNFLVFSALVPRLLGARVLLDMRDPFPEFFRSRYGVPEDHPAVRLLLAEERISARFASAVLTAIPAMAALYERTGVPAERIHVVYNAPDPRLFDADAEGRREPDDRTMLYAGTVAARYGVDLAVRAVARLRGRIPRLRLRIVGDGDALPALRRLARDEGVADRVVFDAPVSLDRVPGIAGASWAGVQPNRDDPLMRYSFSTKILEWCSLGLPVVCGATIPVAEAFTDEELLMHPPGDLDALCERILEADRDASALAARAKRARAAAERFRFEEQVARLLDAVEGR